MKEHPDKHIRAAIDYARRIFPGGKSAHCFVRYGPSSEHMMSIWTLRYPLTTPGKSSEWSTAAAAKIHHKGFNHGAV
jgi:hypothetical protein